MTSSDADFESRPKRQYGVRGLLVAVTGICCFACICTSQLETFVHLRTSILVVYLIVAVLAFYYLVLGFLLFVLAGLVVAVQFAMTPDKDARSQALETGGRTLRSLLVTLLFALLIVLGGLLVVS